MEQYTIYCTPEQTKKALELGAPIQEHPFETSIIKANEKLFQNIICIDDKYYYLPTAEQLCGWLEKQDIFININHISSFGYSSWLKTINENKYISENLGYVSTHKEALLVAIDAALEYLSNNKK